MFLIFMGHCIFSLNPSFKIITVAKGPRVQGSGKCTRLNSHPPILAAANIARYFIITVPPSFDENISYFRN
jgi:hypothetical protein